jgi:hypothetical protein
MEFQDVVYVIHLAIVSFVVLGPFIGRNNPGILIIHITFSLCLMIHWITNSNVCSLSIIESQLRGSKISDTFTSRILSGIYKNPSNEFIWVITIGLMFVSIYLLLINQRFIEMVECFRSDKSSFFQCVINLFKP